MPSPLLVPQRERVSNRLAIYRRIQRSTSRLLILILAFSGVAFPAFAGAPISVKYFKDRYQKEIAPLLAAYAQVSVVATETVRYTNPQAAVQRRGDLRQLSYFRNHENEKLVSREGGEESVRVAGPEYSFRVRRSGDKPFVIRGLLMQEGSYLQSLASIAPNSSNLKPSFSYLEASLPEFLISGTSIRDVKPDFVGERPVIRVYVERKTPKASDLTTDWWFVLDPNAYWASHGYEMQFKDKLGKIVRLLKQTVEYDEPIDGIPVPRKITLRDTSEGGGETLHETEIQSFRFGPVPIAEFTLEGCGVQVEAPRVGRDWSPGIGIFGLGFLAFVVAIHVRRRHWRRAQFTTANDQQWPAPRPEDRASRWLGRLVIASWLSWAACALSLWIQYHAGVYDTVGWLWTPFAAIGFLAGTVALLFGLWRCVLGPRRQVMLGWALLGILPVLHAAAFVAYMAFEAQRRHLPDTQVHKIGRMAVVTMAKTYAACTLPNRLETDRLVVYYDNSISDPAGDANAMAAHLEALEKILGREQRSKIHWVRGSDRIPEFGLHSVAVSRNGKATNDLDRHEVAHAFLFQFSDRGSDPPMVLLEGWARAVDGFKHDFVKNRSLPAAALDVRQQFHRAQGTNHCLRALLLPEHYHFSVPYAYDLGGAFVDFVLRCHGPEKFLGFYNTVHPDSVDTDCERIFGCDIDELERRFWEDAESQPAIPNEHRSPYRWEVARAYSAMAE